MNVEYAEVADRFRVSKSQVNEIFVDETLPQIDGIDSSQPIFVEQANNQGLTITNGKKIIADRLSVNDFPLNSIAGKKREIRH